MLVDGRSNRQIAAALHVAEGTVAAHVNRIMSKLGVRSRGEATAFAYKNGYFDRPDGPIRAES